MVCASCNGTRWQVAGRVSWSLDLLDLLLNDATLDRVGCHKVEDLLHGLDRCILRTELAGGPRQVAAADDACEAHEILGPAVGAAKESSPGIWTREFKHPDLSKPTTVAYDTKASKGTIDWADGPAGPPKLWPGNPSPPPAPAPPAPAVCGAVHVDTGVGPDPGTKADLGSKPVSSVDECCALCAKTEKCAVWAWHAEQKGKPCHFHTTGSPMNHRVGCYSGVMKPSYAEGA